jgi:hypothetical protein
MQGTAVGIDQLGVSLIAAEQGDGTAKRPVEH